MAEDGRTLWIGDLHEKVTDDLVYELCLQVGPIEKLVIPTEEEGGKKKHQGHAYVVFKHSESVQYAQKVLDGSSLFSQVLSLKAHNLPHPYRTVTRPSNKSSSFLSASSSSSSRFDNSSLRGGLNNRYGRNDFNPKGKGNFQSSNYNSGGYNSYNNQLNDMEQKRQRVLQQQSYALGVHQQAQQQHQAQQQQGLMNVYNFPPPQQHQQQQQNWPMYQNWSQNGSYQSYNQYAGQW